MSLLVPARDEERNLRELLPHLLRLDYPELEVLVLDDGSADGTAEVVRAYAGDRIRLIRGAPLPAGWMGKNWACHQLSGAATGEVLIFCDADVTPRPDAVWRTVAMLEETGADALTALPHHRLGGWVERAVVPLVAQLPVLALLPLRSVGRSRSPSLSMGNGQWFSFTRDAYRRCGGHAAVAGEVVEDVALARRVKRAALRLEAALATKTLTVRMYAGGRQVRQGFRKNLYGLLGARPATFAAGVGVFLLAGVYPWVAALAGSREALLPLALLVGLRTAGARLFAHGAWPALLHPLGALFAVAIGIESALAHRCGSVAWKGRVVSAGGEPGPCGGTVGGQVPVGSSEIPVRTGHS